MKKEEKIDIEKETPLQEAEEMNSSQSEGNEESSALNDEQENPNEEVNETEALKERIAELEDKKKADALIQKEPDLAKLN